MALFKKPGKLITKIWIYILLPTLGILFALSACLTLFFNSFYLNTAIENAAKETANVSSRFLETYRYMLKRFISLTVSDAFRSDVKELLDADGSSYSQCNNLLQEDFSAYMQINDLISSVLIAQKAQNGSLYLYYPYTLRPKRGEVDYNVFESGGGISFLPSSPSLYNGLDESMSIVLPLKYLEHENFIVLSENEEETELVFCFFLDTEAVYNYLRLFCNDNSEGILYLATEEGECLSLPGGSKEYETVALDNVKNVVGSMMGESPEYAQSGEYHIFCAPVLEDSLYLVNVVPESVFMQQYIYIRSLFFTVGITAVACIIVSSVLLSFFITKPLKKLMYALHTIETGTYRGKMPISSNDEIEQLNDAIDSMYCTIQEQIRRIKREEDEKYNTQMQLLSEQMNPHFLYNALEFINMEVINGHNENASIMISNLGNYLRIGLAYGENLLPFSQEVEHAVSYINIMNYRFSQSVQVTTQIPKQILARPVVKCILQPLVENSLKHGFRVGTSNGFPIAPLITISVEFVGDSLEISVIDNGAGINVERAAQVTKRQYDEADGSRHVGLNNVYRRLASYYGEADILFSSIPFFENRVTIVLPAKYFVSEEENRVELQEEKV